MIDNLLVITLFLFVLSTRLTKTQKKKVMTFSFPLLIFTTKGANIYQKKTDGAKREKPEKLETELVITGR